MEKRGKKRPRRPCVGASSRPLRTEARLRRIRNLIRTTVTTKKNKHRVQTSGRRAPPKITSCFQTNQSNLFFISQHNRVTTKTTGNMNWNRTNDNVVQGLTLYSSYFMTPRSSRPRKTPWTSAESQAAKQILGNKMEMFFFFFTKLKKRNQK